MSESQTNADGAGAGAGRYFRPILWILFLSFLAFWPIRGCAGERSYRGRGYGRYYDLRQIGMALQTYAAENGGRLPPTLWALYPAHLYDPRILASPGASAGAEADALEQYIFTHPGEALADLPETAPLVIYPHPTPDGQVRCTVLHAGGYVQQYHSMELLTLGDAGGLQ